MTLPELLAAELRRDGARPFLTWYDDATGERIELSIVTIANWAAKTANLLVDEYGVEPGDPVSLAPADHWLTAVAALGAWTAGACVVVGTAGEVSLPSDPPAFMTAVLPQPDALLVPPPGASIPALRAEGREWTASDLATAAAHGAHEHGLPPGARVLSTLPLDTVNGLDASLLVPLAASGSVVWCVNADETRLAARAATERVTHTAGLSIAGFAQLL